MKCTLYLPSLYQARHQYTRLHNMSSVKKKSGATWSLRCEDVFRNLYVTLRGNAARDCDGEKLGHIVHAAADKKAGKIIVSYEKTSFTSTLSIADFNTEVDDFTRRFRGAVGDVKSFLTLMEETSNGLTIRLVHNVNTTSHPKKKRRLTHAELSSDISLQLPSTSFSNDDSSDQPSYASTSTPKSFRESPPPVTGPPKTTRNWISFKEVIGDAVNQIRHDSDISVGETTLLFEDIQPLPADSVIVPVEQTSFADSTNVSVQQTSFADSTNISVQQTSSADSTTVSVERASSANSKDVPVEQAAARPPVRAKLPDEDSITDRVTDPERASADAQPGFATLIAARAVESSEISDEKIVGRFTVSVANLMHPPDDYMCRQIDQAYVEELSLRLMNDATAAAITIIPVMIDPVNASGKQDIDMTKISSYKLWTLGGNHLIEALQRPGQDASRNLTVDVYVGLHRGDARRIGNQHNAKTRSKPLTVLEELQLIRRVLYDITGTDEDARIGELTTEVKKECRYQMALDETTDVGDQSMKDSFMIASYSPAVWTAAVTVLTRSKNAMRPRAFRDFRGVEDDVVIALLDRVAHREMTMQKAKTFIAEEKRLALLRKKFVLKTNSDSWEDACHKFPEFTRDDVLRQLTKNVNLHRMIVPEAFNDHCFAALNGRNLPTDPADQLQIKATWGASIDLGDLPESKEWRETVTKFAREQAKLTKNKEWYEKLLKRT